MVYRNGLLKIINKKIDRISAGIKEFKLRDHIYFSDHPGKILLSNFIEGLARGFGMAVGFTFLGALTVYLLQIIVKWKLPLIGEAIGEIIRIVQDNIQKTGGKPG